MLLTLALVSAQGFFSVVIGSDLTIDALTFKADSGRVYLELHFDLPRSALTHAKSEGGWFGAANFEVLIERDSVALAQDEWRVEDVAATPEALASGQRIVDARIYQMLPGTYQILVSVTDSLSCTRTVRSKTVEVEPYPVGRFSFSDIQLAQHVVEGNIHPRFDRGGFSIIPNPRKLYAPPAPVNYYLEIYPTIGDTLPHDYRISPSILLNSTGILRTLPAIKRSGSGPIAVIDTFSIAGLPGDTYFFQLEITSENSSFTRNTKFYVFLPDSLIAVTPEENYDSLAIIEEFEQVGFLLTREQVAEANKMRIKGKAQFLKQLWRRYDDDPKTPEVPLRKVFRTRVKEADDRWTNSRSVGHETDRGRIYVIHGEPDDREIHTLDSHAKPYETWTYNSLQGGVLFAFVDRSALGEFTLVHSTFQGEVFNPGWYENYVVKSTVDTRK